MDPTSLTSFVTLMVAVSVATERIVEVLKGWKPESWLFKLNTDPAQEAHRCACIHILAGCCGTLVAAGGNINVFAALPARGWPVAATGIPSLVFQFGSWLVTGVLASGGSAFWNHALDLLKATKVQQEKSAGV